MNAPDQPNWQPLLALVGEDAAADFMYMGNRNHVHLYKHRMTRLYLNIDDAGRTYDYTSCLDAYLQNFNPEACARRAMGK